METTNSEGEDINQGYITIYETEIKLPEDEETYDPNAIFKIMIRQSDDELESVRFQISRENELLFLYEGDYNREQFEEIKEKQGLEMEFEDFPNVVRQVLDDVMNDNSLEEEQQYSLQMSYTGQFNSKEEEEDNIEEEDGSEHSTLFFLVSQKLDFCTVEIFNLEFHRADPERIQKISQYRYKVVQQKLHQAEIDYKDYKKRALRQSPNILNNFNEDEI